MESTNQAQMRSAQELLNDSKRTLPENCVEYMLCIIDEQLGSRETFEELEAVRKQALELAESLTANYIWQREPFQLELKTEEGLAYLDGTTDFGDCIEDEWLIVYILRELSKAVPNLWIRACDGDGEFLLVEAAGVLPNWLTPEIDSNRVWIHRGQLRIIPAGPHPIERSKPLSLSQAVADIALRSGSLIHSPFIEAEAFYRLEKYPAQLRTSIHRALASVPRTLAAVLHERPQAVAAAAESFHLRDSSSLKRLASNPGRLVFPPQDLVTVSVKFNRVIFARLKSEQVNSPSLRPALTESSEGPQGATGDTEQKAEAHELGRKLTPAFELLVANAKGLDRWAAIEAERVLQIVQDLDASSLPTDEQIGTWKDIDRHDDQSWLDIGLDDLEETLQGRSRGGGEDKAHCQDSGFGDKSTQTDLRKIVARFEAFLNDESAGIDGTEIDDMDQDDEDEDEWAGGEGLKEESEDDSEDEDEDKEVSFDEGQFAQMMREMMGLSPEKAGREKRPRPAKATGPEQLDENDDDGLERVMAQTEMELRQHGVLALDPKPREKAVAVIAERPSSGQGVALEGAMDSGASDDEEVSLDYGLAKNLLESFKSQGGMAGPAGNILGLMGLRLPRDEDDGDGQEPEQAHDEDE